MRQIGYALLSSALLLSPLAATGAFAQTTESGNNSPAQSASPSTPGMPNTVSPPGAAISTQSTTGTGQTASPDSPAAQNANPPGGQPGTGSGMGKVSGTAAGN